MRINLSIFAALLFISISFSIRCEFNATIPLLAVSSSQGDVVFVKVQAVPIKGVFLDSKIDVGEGLPESLRDAYTFSNPQCGYVVDFPDSLGKVEGPSGGLAFAVFFSYLPDLPPEDVAFSGMIDGLGNVYPVGGVFEKLSAAKKKGFRRIFLPYPSRLEYFLYLLLKDKIGVDVYFIRNVSEALDVLSGGEYKFSPDYLFTLPNETISEEYPGELFKDGYELIREIYVKELKRVNDSLPEEFATYYYGILNHSDKVAEKGFYYTAANDLFNLYGELFALSRLKDSKESEYESFVEECTSMAFHPYTWDNFEYIAGAKVRVERAIKALATYKSSKEKTVEERVYGLYELGSAYAWCSLAKALNKQGKEPILSEEWERIKLLAKEKVIESNYSQDLVEAYVEEDYPLVLYLWAYESDSNYSGRGGFWREVYLSQARYLRITGRNYEEVESLANRLGWVHDVIIAQKINEKKKDFMTSLIEAFKSFLRLSVVAS